MEHFIRIAFWITFSGCLQTKSRPISDFGDIYMREHVECPSDSTFYAPTNVERRCITTALDCVMRELNGTVKEECKDPYEYINQAVEFLVLQIKDRSEKGHALTDSNDCACERWPQRPFSEFLEETLSLLQLENADPLLS